jgi:uncharacterized protein (TIGR03435 family)
MLAPARIVAVLVISASAIGAGEAQAPTFEAASVKVNRTGDRARVMPMPSGQYIATAVTLRDLVLGTYLLHASQLVGGPAWFATARFDINARTERPLAGGPAAFRPLVEGLLAERFGFRAHHDVREMDAYVLERARPDGTPGSQLQPSQADCNVLDPSPQPRRPSVRDGWPPCGLASTRDISSETGRITRIDVKRSATTLAEFATTLYGAMGKPVVDQTGLGGRFDLEYSYAPPPTAVAVGEPRPEGPTLLIALEEQLGLRIRPRRVRVPVLVIDAAEMPALD